jgi:hypothetical protein
LEKVARAASSLKLQAANLANASRVMFSGFDAVATTLSSMRMPP